MVSVNNSASNAYALSSLRQINASLQTTQNRIASGLKVASASDNASVWSTAQGIRSDLSTQESVKSGISVAMARADSATAALDTISDLYAQIKEKSIAATASPPADYSGVIADITALQNQIKSIGASAGFEGKSWLKDAGATTVNTSISQGTLATQSFTVVDILAATDPLAALAAPTNKATVEGLSALVDAAQTAITDYTSKVAGFSKLLSTQSDFLDKIADIRNNALSALVDADMEKESAKVSALQVKQQLAYQALSIGNASTQNVLRLFQ